MNGKLKITVKSYDHDYYNFKIISSINTRKDRLTGIIYSKTRQMFVVDESIQLSATYKKKYYHYGWYCKRFCQDQLCRGYY